MNNYLIRPAVIEELDLLESFHQAIVEAERPYGDTVKDKDVSYYNLEELILSDLSLVLVGEVQGKIVSSGYAKIVSSKDYYRHSHHVHLGFMYTLPEYRGRGIIKSLIGDLLAWAKSQGIDEARLEVYTENRSAIKAYTNSGFKSNLLEMRMEI